MTMHGENNGHTANGNGYLENGRPHSRVDGNRVAGLALGKALPPQNILAEEGVLGSILLDNDVFRDVAPLLSVDRFYRDVHQIIYGAVVALFAAGLPVDVVTLSNHLKAKGKLDRIGGLDTIFGVVRGVPHAANAKYYAQIVHQNAVKRELIHSANETLREAYSDEFTAEELLASASGRIARIESAESADLDEDLEAATAADIRRHVSGVRWLWPHWIVASHMTVVAAEPSTGKTRFAMDLCRRMWHCLPWPDGCMATVPMHTPTLWVSSDQVHGEMIHAMEAFGLPDEAVYFNSSPSDPFGGLKLDDPSEIRGLRRRIKRYRPGMVVIDTVNKATRKALYRPEDAEAFFGPIVAVARDLQVPILALTHLAKSGDALDRRIHGTARVLIKMSKPEGDETTNRRRLWVAEIREGRAPASLGVEMGDDGNDYDGHPPARGETKGASGSGKPGKGPSAAVRAAMTWLGDLLKDGPIYCRKAVEDAVRAGHGRSTFFKAAAELGVISGGPKGDKFYRLPTPEELEEEYDPDDPDDPDSEGDE